MKIVIACEQRCFQTKVSLLSDLGELGHEILDFSPAQEEIGDYPDFAALAAQAVSNGEAERAILIGGTGIGMSIAANKIKGVRAALCYDELSAQMSRSHNDANVLCLSADLFSDQLVTHMVNLWLATSFEGGRHARRVNKIDEIEASIRNNLDQSR